MSATPRKVYREIACLLRAHMNCVKSGNTEWETNHHDKIEKLVREFLPSGGGVDNGTRLEWDESTPEKLVFTAGFHHMDDYGSYSGWTHHKIIVTGSLESGFNLRITGKNENDIKEYLADLYHTALSVNVISLDSGNFQYAGRE